MFTVLLPVAVEDMGMWYWYFSAILIFQTFRLLDNKSLKIEGLR